MVNSVGRLVDPPIYIRQGGSVNSGFGIHNGKESAPGAWAYFCEESRNKRGLQVVPESGWVTHGNLGARAPPPECLPVFSLPPPGLNYCCGSAK